MVKPYHHRNHHYNAWVTQVRYVETSLNSHLYNHGLSPNKLLISCRHACAHTCMHTHVCIHMHMCAYTHTHTHARTHTHIHIHTHTQHPVIEKNNNTSKEREDNRINISFFVFSNEEKSFVAHAETNCYGQLL